ncbi:MAG: hypothetical protein EON59_12710, partial [Alphaproteobacteria bacterium]
MAHGVDGAEPSLNSELPFEAKWIDARERVLTPWLTLDRAANRQFFPNAVIKYRGEVGHLYANHKPQAARAFLNRTLTLGVWKWQTNESIQNEMQTIADHDSQDGLALRVGHCGYTRKAKALV